MLNSLKNTFLSFTINNTSTTLLSAQQTPTSSSESKRLLRHRQQTKSFPAKIKIATLAAGNYSSLSTTYLSLSSKINTGKNLMDEEYYLNKYDEYEKNDCWDYVFQRINMESENQSRKLSLCCDLSNSFHEKNRYRNVLPYDQNRIKLKCVISDNDSYINASPLDLSFAHRNYILTQGPLPNTACDFWQMVYEQNVSICIMLSKVMEKSFIKCHSYFPRKELSKIKFDHFECELENEVNKPNYIVRHIRLTPLESFKKIYTDVNECKQLQLTDSPRTIYHYQFTTWPDFGVPEHTDHFLEFLEDVRNTRDKLIIKEQEKKFHETSVNKTNVNFSPIVCHCSAGIGRTGTFVIVDTVLSMIEKKRLLERNNTKEQLINIEDNYFDKVEWIDGQVKQLNTLEELVIYIRRHRMGLIQTSQQLRFCWKTIVDWIKKTQPKLIDKSPLLAITATNFPVSPVPLANCTSLIVESNQTKTAASDPSPSSPSSLLLKQQQEEEEAETTFVAASGSSLPSILTDIRWSLSPEQQPQQSAAVETISPTTTTLPIVNHNETTSSTVVKVPLTPPTSPISSLPSPQSPPPPSSSAAGTPPPSSTTTN